MARQNKKNPNLKMFGVFVLACQVIMGAMYAAMFKYDTKSEAASNDESPVAFYWPMFQDVHIMIFVGFGFLMTFLGRHGFGSVGMNFMIAAFVVQWAILCNGIATALCEKDGDVSSIPIKMTDLVEGDFAAAAVLISFGAILGRVSPLQLSVMAIFEIIFYNINEKLGASTLKAEDVGGSMFVHAFGAYFGLAVSFAMAKGRYSVYADHPLNVSTKTSDMFAMVGTLFLWVFWPSFTGVLAVGQQKYRVVVNTLLALAASCWSSFGLTLLCRTESKFNMVDIQNATLAGGVAIGSACNLVIQPSGAILIGAVSAVISVLGYTSWSPKMEAKWGIFDTCGVHNLHGMPGIIGGISGVLCAFLVPDEAYSAEGGVKTVYPARETESAGKQASRQLGALALTVAVALFSGYITGLILMLLGSNGVAEGDEYKDEIYWEIEELELPARQHEASEVS